MENIKKLILEKASYTSAMEVYGAMCKDILGDLKVDQASIWHFQDHLNSLICKYCLSKSENSDLEGTIISKSDFPKFFTALIENVSIKADDVFLAPQLHELLESYYIKNGITSAMAYIIYINDKPFGVLFCETKTAQRNWTEHDIDYLRVITVMAGAELKSI